MSKLITFGKEARQQLLEGVDIVAEAVGCSLGPKGRNALIGSQFNTPQIVNDGVTIAKNIELKDPLQNAGIKIIQETSKKTNDAAGDGTTTATILAQSIIKEGIKKLDAGCNPVQLKEGIQAATREVIKFIKEKARDVDDTTLSQVASISAGNNEEIGKLIASAIEKVGEDGVVTVEESKTNETSLDSAEGMLLEKGYLSPYFVTDGERQECVLERPFVLCVDKKINLVQELVPILEFVAKNQASLLLVAEDVEGEALGALVVNTMRKVIRAAAVRAPGFGETRKAILQDLAVLTGGTLWTEDLGIKLDEVQPTFFGHANRVVITRDETTIVVTDSNPELETHIKGLKGMIEQEKDDYAKEKLQERIAKLTGGVAVIKVGASTEVELKERKLRIEDALNATKAAQAEGIVAGGGYTLLEAQEKCDRTFTSESFRKDFDEGYDLLINSLSLPAKLIAQNAGIDGDIVIKNCKEKKLGYNALTNNYENLLETGVIDPAKVTRSALENASSIASMLLTTQVAIVDEPVKPEEAFKPQGTVPMM